MRRPFDPAAHELDPSFRLTKFADLKGWGCKVPQEVLLKLLEGLNQNQEGNSELAEQAHFQYVAAAPRIGKLTKIIFAPVGNLLENENGGHACLVFEKHPQIVEMFSCFTDAQNFPTSFETNGQKNINLHFTFTYGRMISQ